MPHKSNAFDILLDFSIVYLQNDFWSVKMSDMVVWEDILKIIYNELGEKTGDVFKEFYRDFPIEEQLTGAFEVLKKIFGEEKTKELLKNVKK